MDQNQIIKDTIVESNLHNISAGNDEELKAILERIKNGDPAREAVDPLIQAIPTSELKGKQAERDGEFDFGSPLKREACGGLELTDNDLIKRQKKVLGEMVKGMGRNLLEGKSIMNVSLPIIVFSKDTLLMRAA